jgi:hypothetical protein
MTTRTNPLISFIAADQQHTIGHTRSQLEEGAGFCEPARVSDDLHDNYLIGQSAYLMGYPIRRVHASYLAGYMAEYDDHEQAVIAWRRAAARGA